MKDLHNIVSAQRVIDPQAVGTTGTGKTGKIIDLQGFGGVEFVLAYGSITATNAVFTAVVKEGDVTGTLTSVADADLLGTEALAGLAAGARTSGTGQNVTKRVGYKGIKRYVRVDAVQTGVTSVGCVGVDAILFNASTAPLANPTASQ